MEPIVEGSGDIVPLVMRWPKNRRLVPPKTHFSVEKVRLASESRRKGLRRSMLCF